jgi:hypothetical protein
VSAAVGDDEAVFRQQATNLVNQSGALYHRLTAQAVNGLDILLLDALEGTKRMVGRWAASAIASASAASFLLDLTKGLTNCGAISCTSWPYD